MLQLIPIPDLLERLREAGKHDDANVLLAADQSWQDLDPVTKEFVLDRLQLDVRLAEIEEVSVVRRRGRPASPENLFLRIGAPEGRYQELMHLAAYTEHATGGRAMLDTEKLARLALRRGNALRGRRIVDVLDAAWRAERQDDEPEEPAAERSFIRFSLPPGHEVVNEYWVEEPFGKVAVLRDRQRDLRYHIEEPVLSANEATLLQLANERIRETVIMEDEDPDDRAAHLAHTTFDVLRRLGVTSNPILSYRLAYYVLRNYAGFGRIHIPLRDPLVEDVSCNGPGLPVFVAHATYDSLPTPIVLPELELNAFTIKLAQQGGKMLSVAHPLVDATLADGSRVQAALGREVTAHGSAFTIRKFREDPLTAVDLIQYGTLSLEAVAMLWLAVDMGRNLIVMGSTASGKTSTLNALAQFVPPMRKVVTIEDTREITLKHANWLAAVTREAFTGGGSHEIQMYDLLRAALRQRPDYLIVGEIRGAEGLTLFQAMSTGHTCFSTMHAGSVENAVHRLENPPINVPRVMISSLDYFLVQSQVDIGGEPKRRMLALTELSGIDPSTRTVRARDVFEWDGQHDRHVPHGESRVLEEARRRRGWTRNRLDEEIQERRKVLGKLVDNGERHYSRVAEAVRDYYRRHADIDRGVARTAHEARMLLKGTPVPASEEEGEA